MCYHLHLPVIINFDYVRARRKGRGSRSKARIGPKRKSHHKPDETLTSLSLPSEWITDVEAPCGWMNVSCEDSDELRLCRVSHQEVTQCPPLVVSRSLIVKADHSWILHVHGHAVDPTLTPSLAEIPSLLDISSMSTLLQKVSSLNTCVGNPEAKFVALCETKKNKQFLSASKQVIAYLDSGISVILDGQEYQRAKYRSML